MFSTSGQYNLSLWVTLYCVKKQAFDGQIIALGATGGKQHLTSVAVNSFGNLISGIFNYLASFLALTVHR
jgi:hypothetical protein